MKKGQIKIQQMAFVLVAVMIFFALAGLFYFTLLSSDITSSAESLREKEVKESVRKLSGSPEFAWTIDDCPSCVDFDKVLALKERASYEDYWQFPYLSVERVYPEGTGECTRQNYPDCGEITLVNTGEEYVSYSAFVSLCRREGGEGYNKCELGKIIMGFKTIQ